MDIRDLVFKNRSYRRFYQDHAIDRETLVELVDLARHSASGNNLQPLKFYLSVDPETKSVTIALTATTGGKKIFGRAIASATLA